MTVQYERRGIRVMTTAEFLELPEHPRQRDTEQRANWASAHHLNQPAPTHTGVSVAEMPDGKIFCVDGHTRALLWRTGHLPMPEQIEAQVYFCLTTEGLHQVYEAHDAITAAKGPKDQVQSAYRLVGIRPCSPIFKTGIGVQNILTHAEGFTMGGILPARIEPIADVVGEWQDAILALDGLDFAKKLLPAPYASAALLILTRDGGDALPFLQAVRGRDGARTAETMDPVCAVFAYLESADYVRLGKADNLTPTQKYATVAAVMINGYAAWKADTGHAFAKFPTTQRRLLTFHAFKKPKDEAGEPRSGTAAQTSIPAT